ncbi:hypothetical protein FHS96_001350 [Sphingomonas zeicaulis]
MSEIQLRSILRPSTVARAFNGDAEELGLLCHGRWAPVASVARAGPIAGQKGPRGGEVATPACCVGGEYNGDTPADQ